MQTRLVDLKTRLLQTWGGFWKRGFWLLPVLVAATLVLFPFDWLGKIWPTYAMLFDLVFASVLAHEIGHATVFCLAGLLILLAFPALRRRPVLYLGIMALGALGEEVLQSLFKQHLPSVWDGRDMLLDLVGFGLAYGMVMLLRSRG